ncbi:MAG: OmpH family outer membrane protein [Bdellovibrionales bacterium]
MKFLILSLFIFLSYDAFAKVGYVDVVKVIESTKQGKRVKARLEKNLARAKRSMKTMDENLKRERSELEKALPLLSEEKRAQKIQQFQQKVLKSQQEAEKKQLELKNLEEQLMNPVVVKIKGVIATVANKDGYEVVHNLDKNVLWVSPKSDLTKKVYSLFNKKHK